MREIKENKEETFWQWLNKLAVEVGDWAGEPSRHPRIPPEVEAVGGFMLVGVVASVALAILLSPWWLIVTIPGGALLFLHGVWRDDI